MHTQAVTFSFTAPRPRAWSQICLIGEAAEARALKQGIHTTEISRLDWGGGFHKRYQGYRYWTSRGYMDAHLGRHAAAKLSPKGSSVPKGHIAVLVVGFAEKE